MPKSNTGRRALAAMALILMTACNGAGAGELPTFKLTIRNGRFSPETIKVPAGVKFKILVTNLGPGPEEFESLSLRKETVMGEGVTRPVVFAPLKPGSYEFFGEFHPDTAKGRIVAR